ncbi:MAG TPA: serine hydrolase domain-containing protein [Pyrinomonadaceae bacterium]|nr:serine hydrolase domain-containing protein [Pyrinomonadaceae bacterium]
MRFKARGLVALIMTTTLLGPALFGLGRARSIAEHSVDRIGQPSDSARMARFETLLESLRQDLKIPAYSAAIVKNQKVIWAKGFGYADVENKIPATEHTAYHLASLTKTFASTILMQLVQEGKVKLDDPVSKYGIVLESNGVIKVRHLFSHTSEGNPGEQYHYNGNRFAELDKVIQKAGGKSFAELLISNILDPLGMNETAPNVPRTVSTGSPTNTDDGARSGALITEKHQQRFDTVVKILAQPYALDREFKITKISYPQSFSASAGLISTVLDMAKYDIAIDQNKFLSKETQQLAFTPTVSTKGETLPYGLGWFTTNYKGTKLLWHYGYWTGNSSFILKVPEQKMTFIIMANSDNLSRPTDLGAGNALSSAVGMAFLKTFIFPEKFGETIPEINWSAPVAELKKQLNVLSSKPYADIYRTDLVTKVRIFQSVGRVNDGLPLVRLYGELYSRPMPADLVKLPLVAQIVEVLDNEDKTVPFSLASSQEIRIFAIGEGQPGEMFDYGWIEDDKGSRVWEMKEPQTTHAGGAGKNRIVDAQITLPAGNYKLRYKTDDSHSFDHWNSLPPDINFWGIAVYKK